MARLSKESLKEIPDATHYLGYIGGTGVKVRDLVDTISELESEKAELLAALRWALTEGAKGFYTAESGADQFYYCKFCHAVAQHTEKLNHEDNCKLFHVKKLARAAIQHAEKE